jgi:hypothetical protein
LAIWESTSKSHVRKDVFETLKLGLQQRTPFASVMRSGCTLALASDNHTPALFGGHAASAHAFAQTGAL